MPSPKKQEIDFDLGEFKQVKKGYHILPISPHTM